MTNDLKKKILETLVTLPICIPDTSQRQWVVRCPYCGDSKKSRDHGHFSIKIDMSTDDPIVFRCLRCNESGLLTSQTLEDLNLSIARDTATQLRAANRNAGSSTFFRDKAKDFVVTEPKPSYANMKKLEYLNNRLGINLTYQDCIKYKIILSLSDFLARNIDPLIDKSAFTNIKAGTIREIDAKYIGFLSANNNKITFRDTTENNSGFFGRYYKITLDMYNRSPNTFYSLVNQFDLLYNGEIDVHIAEGTFDILSVYLNLEREASVNSLFFASCGYNLSTIVKYILFMGVNTGINIHLYSDADKSNEDHKKSFNHPLYKIWIDNMIIHRNQFDGEKDYGVSKDKIIDSTYKLIL